MTLESVSALFHDPTYSWQVVEAPSGRDVERDGVILGACCYSTDGLSRRNGEVEGNLGSMRYFGVLPRFHGVCVGRRLLHRVETLMTQAGCVRAMACVPSTRSSMHAWLERRGYRQAGASSYPFAALGHEPAAEAHAQTQLGVFVKPLEGAKEAADGKTAKKTVLSMQQEEGEGEGAGAGAGAEEDDRRSALPHVPGKMHLPPQWRGYSSADIQAFSGLSADGKGGGATEDDLGVD